MDLNKKQLTFFDMFSGIGGFKIALEKAGFKCVGYCDNDKYATKLYREFFNTEEEMSLMMQPQSEPMNCQTLTSCVQDFLAKLSQLLERDEALVSPEAQCFLKSQGFYETKNPNILYSKMLKGYLTTSVEELLQLSLKFSPTLGIQLNGRFLILSSSVYLKTGKECSLSDVLQENVSEKYFLSPQMMQKILVT
jgi:DNA (cytosine-5)-methyltransferase 1